ncbi:hypothetical protein SDRG_06462 [Saprolegnia diclina VS20]|uniref:Uncharacterized protein n=1 Tax=Saprolegnia diclina (strain VS20) TaxID=1156394 RepID=T0S0U3_SAPDV|nr:hypothetical protein SDRG_06462 [Saprolegnia diclina VS20]EQC36357.1 hypothetical protein SDRG_06462 [Saprolegnia diclina VS20]|eukprot:XP_008610463.1 hypothetical protein SDRG_06462 [Saprolegnia diclina VS20]
MNTLTYLKQIEDATHPEATMTETFVSVASTGALYRVYVFLTADASKFSYSCAGLVMTTQLTGAAVDMYRRRVMLLSPELLEAIATYLPSEGMTAFLAALPEQMRTPVLQLIATLSKALGLEVVWPTLNLAILTQLANANDVIAQLLTVNPRLSVMVYGLPHVPVVATPPRTWPRLDHISISLTMKKRAILPRVLATLQEVLLANASLRSIDVHFAVLRSQSSTSQSNALSALVDLLVSMKSVTKLSLRAIYKVRFPDAAAEALAAWIEATPLTSLTLNNFYELSPRQRYWLKPTLVALALPNTDLQLGNSGCPMSRHLTHLDLRLSGSSPMQSVAGVFVQSPLQSLHLCLSSTATDSDMHATQHFLEVDLPHLHQLLTLRLTNVRLSTTHCLTLAPLVPRYAHLSLTSNKMGDTGVLALAPFLRHTLQLETLALVGQGFGDVGASTLSTALVHTTRLSTLDLRRNAIEVDGAAALSSLLGHLPRLAEWRIGNNPLGASGVAALLHAWTYVELTTTTVIDATRTIGKTDDQRVCNALLSDLPPYRTCLISREITNAQEASATAARRLRGDQDQP